MSFSEFCNICNKISPEHYGEYLVKGMNNFYDLLVKVYPSTSEEVQMVEDDIYDGIMALLEPSPVNLEPSPVNIELEELIDSVKLSWQSNEGVFTSLY